jgi:Arc/MetJ-type ribon-helix-helix transcriptional regulator
MRKTITISVPEKMHDYMLEQVGYGSMSEYIRSLVKREQQRRADYASRPRRESMRANDVFVIVEALEQLEKLQAILERKDPPED